MAALVRSKLRYETELTGALPGIRARFEAVAQVDPSTLDDAGFVVGGYCPGTSLVALVTGEIGSGKSTALRYVTESLHPAEHLCLYVTATSGSILELYRQILGALGVDNRGVSRALMLQTIRGQVMELTSAKRLKVLLIIDEASLLRMEVFAELHTLMQFEKDAKPFLPLVMAGQNNLIDSLNYRPAMPLASRVVARSHLEGANLPLMT